MRDRDCNRAFRTDLELYGDESVRIEDLLHYEEHVETCSACRAEKRILDAIKGPGNSGALPPLEEFSRRRLIEEVRGRMDRNRVQTDITFLGNARIKQRFVMTRKYRIAAVAALAAAASVALAFFWFSGAQTNTQSPSFAQGLHLGQVMLVSGDAFIGQKSASIDHELRTGEEIVTGNGRVVVSLPTGIKMLLGSHTHLVAKRYDSEAMEVYLERGRVLASVDPGRVGPVFVVGTAHGKVKVKGTIFHVEATEQHVRATVLRGKVEIVESEREPRQLHIGETSVLGTNESLGIAKTDQKVLQDELHVIELLSNEKSSKIDIQSVPETAQVTIDGVLLGPTPLSASIRSGHRQLELLIDGQSVIKELFGAGEGMRQSRVFDLSEGADSGTVVDREVEGDDGPTRVRRQVRSLKREPTARELLLRAQALRSTGEWDAVADSYRELIEKYPSSNEARASLVSLGEILLEKLDNPTQALIRFNTYLHSTTHGSLAQEALYGKTCALRALGRLEAEKEALQLFLERFPSAFDSPRVKKRLNAIENGFVVL